MLPNLSDPVVITANDGTLFVCWLESIADQTRWVIVGTDRVRYLGPVYEGQDTLQAIKQLVGAWWESKKVGKSV